MQRAVLRFLLVTCALSSIVFVATSHTREARACPAGEHNENCLAESELQEEDDSTVLHVELLQRKVRQSPDASIVVKATVPVAAALQTPGAQDVALPHAVSTSAAHTETDESREEGGVISYDHNGHVCMLCGSPLPGRTRKVYTEFRKDCGQLSSKNGPVASTLLHPAVKLREEASEQLGAERNGFCQLNFAKSCVDAVANRDYLYWAKSIDFNSTTGRRNAAWDGRYCHLNGFLDADIVALQHDFEGMREKASKLCKEKYHNYGIEHLTFIDMMDSARYEDASAPTLYEAERLAAWNCAMGDLGCDLALCAYSYCSKATGMGLYDECHGWDPVLGMPILEQ